MPPKKITLTPKDQLKPTPEVDLFVQDGATAPTTSSAAGSPMKRLTIDITDELHRRIKSKCAERGVKMADEIRVILEQHFS